MSDPGKAVFLSYASQDVEAAKRICDALRAAGVEVWFDAEGGLEHGDEWDAKIRRQIKECVLFLPIISANTQAREEGYFRIEWELAAQRALGIASGVAFILPIVIDDTREPDALVPDRFRAVQWTRLRGGELTPEVKARFLKLWSHRAGVVKHLSAEKGARSGEREIVGAALRRDGSGGGASLSKPGWKAYAGMAAGIIALVAVVGWWMMRGSGGRVERKPVTAAADAQFPQDPELMKAITLVETLNSTMEDHTLAEDLAKAVLARKPTDPETVIVNAYVENRFIMRGFDVSDERHATARRLCERALVLAPDHPEALHVLGQFLAFRAADLPRAVELLRRAVTLRPDRARFYNSYIEALETSNNPEVVRVAEAAAARFPADPIIHYRLAVVYAYVSGDIDKYERALDETIAIGPVATAVLRKITIVLLGRRDVAAAQRWLDRVPGSFRLNDRTVYVRYLVASASGDVNDALRALNALPGNFLSDFGLWPKRMLIGDLLARKGQLDLARREFEAALADIARERVRNPNASLERPEKWLLLWLGREQEAKASANLTYEGTRRPVVLRGLTNLWFNPMTTLLVLGERAKALELLREAVGDDWGRRVLAGAFALDPHLALWRNDPEIQSLLADPATPARDWPKDADLKRAVGLVNGLNSIREDFLLAEEIARKAVEKSPADAEAVTVLAHVESSIITRNFDFTADRTALARRYSERAVQLAPDDPVALAALAMYLTQRGGDHARAEELLRRACTLEPAEPRYARYLALVIGRQNGAAGNAAAIQRLEQIAGQFPRDPLAHYDLSIRYRDNGRYPEAERELDATIALAPIANAIDWKARFALMRGDLPATKMWLDRVPVRLQAEERSVLSCVAYALFSGDVAYGLKSLNRFAETWFYDASNYTGPRSLLLGALREREGNLELARTHYEAALTEIRRYRDEHPSDPGTQSAEAWALLGLGRAPEARVASKIVFAGIARPNRYFPPGLWWFQNIARTLLLDDRAAAVALIREAAEQPFVREPLRLRLEQDPRMAPFRHDPEITALLAEPQEGVTPGADAAPLPADWPKNPELKKAIAPLDRLDAIPEDFRLAEQLVQQVLDKSPTDSEAVTAMARVHSMWLLRGWDRSNARYQKAKAAAERALQLAPDEPEALCALATYLYTRGSENQRALDLAQRAADLAPREPRFHRLRDNCLFVMTLSAPTVEPDYTVEHQNKALEKAIASARHTIELFPRDPLVHYELARRYRDLGRWAEFERETDVTLGLAPVANAIVWKARSRFALHGDLPGMKVLLDQVPARVRAIERTVFSYFLYAAFSGDTREGLEALNGMTEDWMLDFDYRGPRALPVGALLELSGKKELARLQYEAALVELQRGRSANPTDVQSYLNEAWILHGLGRDAEARTALRIFNEGLTRPFAASPMTTWWFQPIAANLLMGERVTALALIREGAASIREARATIRSRLALDPRMARFRDDPEIKALLAEPEGTRGQRTEDGGQRTVDGGQVAGKTAATSPAAVPTPARELAGKALALVQGLDATREDFALAEDYCQRALKLDPTDGEVWAVYAQVHSAFGYRGWDSSPERREQNRVMAERAIRLAPDSVQAKLAQAGAWTSFNINRPETEKLLREVVAQEPGNQPALRFLAVTMLNQGKLDECLALNERSAALPGGDPLALLNNARYLWQRGRQAEGYVILQRSLAQRPFNSSLILKTNMEITWRGDLAAAEATLQQIPQSALLEDRANYTAGLLRFYQRHADQALEAWGSFPRDYYMDFAYDGPKGLLVGLADELDHRDAAAKVEWRTALQLVEKRIAATPNKPAPYYYQAYLLACLGEKAAAGEALRTCEQLSGIKYTPGSEMTYEMALIYVRLGRLDEVFAQPFRFFGRVKVDPRMEALRADPRYARLLAEHERQKAEANK